MISAAEHRHACESTIALEATHLHIGESTRDIECPFCPIGDKEKGSLVVTRNSIGYVYMCHRAKCGAKGRITSSGAPLPALLSTKPEYTKYKGTLEPLRDEHQRYLILNYNITVAEMTANSIKWAPDRNAYAIPLTDVYGLVYGYEFKAYKEFSAHPDMYSKAGKAIRHIERENTGLYYPALVPEVYGLEPVIRELGTRVVIVEDVFSAIRVHRIENCVALLGTNMNMLKAMELQENFEEVVLALDPDAYKMAIKIIANYGLYFNRFSIKQLVCDPKDMSEDELEREFLTV